MSLLPTKNPDPARGADGCPSMATSRSSHMRSTMERIRAFWYAPQTTIAGSTTRTETGQGVDDRDGRRDAELLGRKQRRRNQHPEPERSGESRAQQSRTGGRERPDSGPLGVAQAGELLPVTMDHVDGVVHADPDRQRRDDRSDQRCRGSRAAPSCPARRSGRTRSGLPRRYPAWAAAASPRRRWLGCSARRQRSC